MSKKATLSGLLHEELEPRLLYSAGAEAVLLDDDQADTEGAIVETIVETHTEILQVEIMQQDSAQNEPVQEVVFIDANVPEYDQLMADLAGKDNIDVYILDGSVDGVEQISAVLENYQGLDAIHLISHGDGQGLYLGNGSLNNDNIDVYSDTITGWQSALSEQADLLIYGCDVAADEEGLALLDTLNALTATDIAASDDITGHASLGGDWDLEYQAGQIETSLAFSEALQQDWVGILPPDSAPVNSVPSAQSTTQGVSLTLSSGNSNLISISDSDGDTPTVTLSVTNGTLTLASTTGLTFGTGDGTDDPSIAITGSIADINTALDGLVYKPTPGWNGTETLTIVTNDNHSGQGGPLSDTDAVTINVTANSAPVLDNSGSPSFTTITEDDLATAGDTIASIVGTSITDADSGASEGIAVTGLNGSNGTWQYKVDAGAWTDVGTVSNTSALLLKDTDSLRFVPDGLNADAASISYSAWDQSSGSAGSKVDASSTGGTTAFSTASETATITVTAVNDNPIISNLAGDTLAYTEGSGAQIIEQGGDVSVTDVDSSNFSSGTLTVSIPVGNAPAEDVVSINHQGSGAGQIGVSGNEVRYQGDSIGTFVGGSAGADLVITFDSDATPTAVQALLQNITYENTDTSTATLGARTVQFDLTDGDGGNSLSMATTVNVNDAVNTLPTAAGNTVSTNEDTGYTFTAADFGYSDADGDPMASIKITTLESVGTLQLNGVDVTLNQVISKADIDTGKLKFVPVANANGAAYDSFDFSVNDGTADSAGSYTMNLDVTAVNDLPTAANNTITTNEDSSYVFTAADFGFSDIDGDTLASVKITSLESAGSMQLSGVDVTLNQVISKADIDAGNLTFTPVTNANGAAYDSFAFSVNDGTADSGSSYTMTVDVTPQNDTPIATNNTVSTIEDTARVFSAADFNFSDIDGDSMASVKITSLENVGSLKLNGVDVTLNQVISKADIDAGNLVFTPVSGASGIGYDSFGFSVNDGSADSAANYTMTLDINPANDAPTISGTPPGSVTTGSNYIFIPSANDINGDTLTYSVSNLPPWASFNTSTGEISGTPSDTDAGTYANIVISVNDGTETISLAAFDINVNQAAPTYSLEASGPDITIANIESYKSTEPLAETETSAEKIEEDAVITTEKNTDITDIEVNVDKDGKPTVLLKHGSQALVQALTDNQSGADTINIITPDDLANEENILIESISPWQQESQAFAIDLQKALDELNQQLSADGHAEEINGQIILTTAAGVTIGLTAGFVTWALQGSSLLTALLTTLPAWNTFDPLPVLNAQKNKKEISAENAQDGDGIDSVFANFSDNENQ